MSEPTTCEACGHPVDDDAPRCVGCGIVLRGDAPLEASRPYSPPLGAPFVLPAPGRPLEVLVETAAAADASPRRPIGKLATLLALVIGALVAIVQLHDDAGETTDEAFLRAAAELERLVPAALALPPPSGASSLDALVARHPEVAREHRPLAPPAGGGPHEVFAAFLARAVELDPDWAIQLGVHPHPRGLSLGGVDDRAALRWLLLCRDLATMVEVEAPGASRHDAVDRELLRGIARVGLEWDAAARDHDVLSWVSTWLDGLAQLELIDCCPVAERRAVISARLEALPAALALARARLDRPARAQVLSLARRLDDAVAYVMQLPLGDDLAGLRGRAAAVDALRRFQTALRDDVQPRATGPLGVGPRNYALLLSAHHRLVDTPGQVLSHAVASLRAAAKRARAHAAQLGPPGATARVSGPPATEALVPELADVARELVLGAPADPGVSFGDMPLLWRLDPVDAYYLPAGPLGPAATPRVLRSPRSDTVVDVELEGIWNRHVVAHEVQPGHHLQHLLARESACALRRAYRDGVTQEGWAVLAEDLVHPRCRPGPLHDWAVAWDDAARAMDAALDVVAHCGLADEDQLLRWTRARSGDPAADLSRVGELCRFPGILAGYHLGRRELEALRGKVERRWGRQWDPRAFHEVVLRSGPIPVSLLGMELASD